MSDEFRAADLDETHIGRVLTVRPHGGENPVTGRLLLIPHRIDDMAVQLLLSGAGDGDEPGLVTVGAGAPVELSPG